MKTKRMFRCCGFAGLFLLACLAGRPVGAGEPASGPLRRLDSNPRYFTDGSGKAILLAGSHNWHNFQDNGHRLPESQDPPPAFDYEAYLDLLERHGHNFFRLWRWEAPKWTDAQPAGTIKFCQPHPWKRTGPGVAADGKPKFDLASFDPAYFERLTQRLAKARDRGMYVSVMLFEGWEMQFTDAWKFHPFHGPNNVNGIDADPNGRGIRYNELQNDAVGKKVLALQEAYVSKVIGTVTDLDNVLYEVCNEAGTSSTKWQSHLINFIHADEAHRPKQHPVGMTFMYAGGTNKISVESPADWISPNPGTGEEGYKDRPSPRYVGKVIVNDTDHLWGHTGGDSVWVWRSSRADEHPLYGRADAESDLAGFVAGRHGTGPRLCVQDRSGGHAPAPNWLGRDMCWRPRSRILDLPRRQPGEFSIDLRNVEGTFRVDWFDVTNAMFLPGKPVKGGGRACLPHRFPARRRCTSSGAMTENRR